MSFLDQRNGVAIGVSTHAALSNTNLFNRLSPSLLLQFAGAETLDPRITFSRGSNATRFNSAGTLVTMSNNQPRFDYDPITLQPKGLLIEEQRTNLLTYSEQFDNAAWAKTQGAVISNTIIAPDGTLTGDKFYEDTADAIHRLERSVAISASTAYTMSFYAKAAERTVVYTRNDSTGANANAAFNLANGTVQYQGAGQTASIQSVGNGWYRCIVTATSSVGATTGIFRISLSNAAVSADIPVGYTGDGTSGIYLWGAQLEAGAFPTSYVKTESAQVTRTADAATMTGANFSSWYNQSEGTLFAEFGPYANAGSSKNPGILQLDNSTTNNMIRMFAGSSTSPVYNIVAGGVTQAYLSLGILNPFAVSKMAGAYKVNDFAKFLNGSTADTDTSGSLPTVNRMLIGSGTGGLADGNIYIRRIAYFNRRLSNTELQGITA